MLRIWPTVAVICLSLSTHSSGGQPAEKNNSQPKKNTPEELAKASRPSVVIIKQMGRDGKQRGMGTGFIISKDGMIATNLHVIGDARPIVVQLEGGKEFPVKVVHASDRKLDLAILKIDGKNLQPLRLGDSDKLNNGQAIVAVGHPQGLKYSIVTGVVSGRPTIDGRRMVQLAIPIERGNSGGPVLDRQGRVLGVVTLKSQVTANLGFAVPVNELKKLIKKPNPIPISRWVTIGRINPDQWQTVFQGNWRQRSGQIVVDGPGEGFGGRSLCLSKSVAPKIPFEIEVTVRLDTESGAGGLAFHADGGDKHYGFYPSSGKLRLSRFMGPEVFSWKVLYNEPSKHYRPGQWNTLKVRVEKDKLLCFVNDRLVIESRDDVLTKGKVGLVKFRTTHVEYKNFRVGKKLASRQPSAELAKKVHELTGKLAINGRPDEATVNSLTPNAPASLAALREQAKLLEQKAKRLRELAKAVHHKTVLDELAKVTDANDDKIDLLKAALLISNIDNEELDLDAYVQHVDRLAKEIVSRFPKKPEEKDKMETLNRELFQRRGFHGSRGDYYNRANSYINQVIDDREGIPITLSLLYMELAKRLDLKIVGIGLPGHFVVEHQPKKGKPHLIDVFEGGKKMSRDDADLKVKMLTGRPLQDEDLKPVTSRALLVRMCYNLSGLARDEKDLSSLIRYQDAVLTIDPNLIEDRMLRAAGRYQAGDKTGAIADLDWLLDNSPPGLNRAKVLQLKRLLNKLN